MAPWQGQEASDFARTLPLPVVMPSAGVRIGQLPMNLMSKIDILIVSLVGDYVEPTKETITSAEERRKRFSDLSLVNQIFK